MRHVSKMAAGVWAGKWGFVPRHRDDSKTACGTATRKGVRAAAFRAFDAMALREYLFNRKLFWEKSATAASARLRSVDCPSCCAALISTLPPLKTEKNRGPRRSANATLYGRFSKA